MSKTEEKYKDALLVIKNTTEILRKCLPLIHPSQHYVNIIENLIEEVLKEDE